RRLLKAKAQVKAKNKKVWALFNLCLEGKVAGMVSPARDILTRPIPSAPRLAVVPGEHSFTVRVLRGRRAPGRSLPILLRPRVPRAQEIIIAIRYASGRISTSSNLIFRWR